ncbi:hypothetical protein J2D73_02795 [Acetobacter sacchari]|uniref:Uncharacterized protein n=2 Tax=Acetobacter sacchari TaxID=2661687 RepID=A0ABS3LS48_9PROT|nr:hypothetical protein [Acetobacter sacchari]
MTDRNQNAPSAALFAAPDLTVRFQAMAWLVEAPGPRSWVETGDPERYRVFGYDIQPLVTEREARLAAEAAVLREHQICVDKHAVDLLLLAQIVHRLKAIVTNGYVYDTTKIRDDLVKWGFIAGDEAEPPSDTPAGRRLALVVELDWLRTKTNWGLRRSADADPSGSTSG